MSRCRCAVRKKRATTLRAMASLVAENESPLSALSELSEPSVSQAPSTARTAATHSTSVDRVDGRDAAAVSRAAEAIEVEARLPGSLAWASAAHTVRFDAVVAGVVDRRPPWAAQKIAPTVE